MSNFLIRFLMNWLVAKDCNSAARSKNKCQQKQTVTFPITTTPLLTLFCRVDHNLLHCQSLLFLY